MLYQSRSYESNIEFMTCGPRKRPGHRVDSRHEVDFRFPLCQLPTPGFLEVNELIRLVAQRAGISSAQASLAVSAMLSYLTARLPSPVVGRIREQLGEVHSHREPDGGEGGGK